MGFQLISGIFSTTKISFLTTKVIRLVVREFGNDDIVHKAVRGRSVKSKTRIRVGCCF
jgi:hypothetical protein